MSSLVETVLRLRLVESYGPFPRAEDFALLRVPEEELSNDTKKREQNRRYHAAYRQRKREMKK